MLLVFAAMARWMLLSNNKEVTTNQNTAKLESHAPHISQVCSGDLEKISVFQEKWSTTDDSQACVREGN